MRAPAFVLGFHGCDEEVGEAALDGHAAIQVSSNEHDWLGNGAYFWENDPARALRWAEHVMRHPQSFHHRIRKPFVVGAIIELGECLDLFNSECLEDVKEAYAILEKVWAENPAITRPVNEPAHAKDIDFTKRHLDCTVINATHKLIEDIGKPPYDTVRGGFTEGAALYEGGRIMAKTHVQICVRNPVQSIRGYFRPLGLPKSVPVSPG